MSNYVIILCSYFLLFSAGFAAQNDICSTPQKGHCIPIGDCPVLLNLLKKRPISPEHEERLKSSSCGFQGVHPKVCCPLGASGATESTSTSPPIPEPPLSNLLPNLKECGLFTEDRIFHGDESQLDGYPWTVLLQYETPNGRNQFHCGGVLINKRYVLTAAHCITEKGAEENWKLVSVRLGEYDRESDRDCDFAFSGFDCCCSDEVVNIGIEEKIVHEQYNPNNTAQYHDIALLRLDRNVKFTDFVRPICLQPVKYITNGSVPGQAATISGWGVTKLTSNSNKKQWARMEIMNNTECESAYAKTGLQLREDQICAITRFGNKKSCTQDSGGALMTDNHQAYSPLNYFAVGVMSLSHPICGQNEYPIIYTKVENYIPWIISKL